MSVLVRGKVGKWTWEGVAQLMVARARRAKGYVDTTQFIDQEEVAREGRVGPRWRPTVARLKFMERAYPEWWDDRD